MPATVRCAYALCVITILYVIGNSCTSYDTVPLGPSAADRPVVYEILPVSGIPGDTLRISGRNFSTATNANVVVFAPSRVARIVSTSATMLRVIVPFGAVSGKLTLCVDDLQTVSGQEFVLRDWRDAFTGYRLEVSGIPVEVERVDAHGKARGKENMQFHFAATGCLKFDGGVFYDDGTQQGKLQFRLSDNLYYISELSADVISIDENARAKDVHEYGVAMRRIPVRGDGSALFELHGRELSKQLDNLHFVRRYQRYNASGNRESEEKYLLVSQSVSEESFIRLRLFRENE